MSCHTFLVDALIGGKSENLLRIEACKEHGGKTLPSPHDACAPHLRVIGAVVTVRQPSVNYVYQTS